MISTNHKARFAKKMNENENVRSDSGCAVAS